MDIFEISDIVIQLMVLVSDEELENLRLTNSFLNNLYNGDSLWKQKIIHNYGDHFLGLKNDNETWKEYYFKLVKNLENETNLNMYRIISNLLDENYEDGTMLNFFNPETEENIFLEIYNVEVIENSRVEVYLEIIFVDLYGDRYEESGFVVYDMDRKEITQDFENVNPDAPNISLIEMINSQGVEELEPADYGY